MLKYLILFSILLSPRSHSAEKYLIYMGGGGEPAGSSTIFDEDIFRAKDFLDKTKWKTEVVFNGGHETTEKLIDYSFSGKSTNKPFTKANFDLVIENLKNKIQNGEIKGNDQLLINIDSHGGQERADLKSHEVYDNQNEAISLDKLEEVIKLAKEKKVKLAIIDNSCFSGTLQKLNTDNSICTISVAGQYNLGRESIGAQILNAANVNKSLEAAYLSSLSKITSLTTPTISTENDKLIRTSIYNAIVPYFLFNNMSDRDLDFYGLSTTGDFQEASINQFLFAPNKDCIQCMVDQLESNMPNLKTQMKKFEKFGLQPKDIQELIKKIDAYNKYLKRYALLYKDSFLARNEMSRYVREKYPEIVVDNYFDLANDKLDSAIKELEITRDIASSEEEKKGWQEAIDYYKKMKSIQDEVLSNIDPSNRKKLIDYRNFVKNESNNSYDFARGISEEYRKIYVKLHKSTMDKKSNPCREFKL